MHPGLYMGGLFLLSGLVLVRWDRFGQRPRAEPASNSVAAILARCRADELPRYPIVRREPHVTPARRPRPTSTAATARPPRPDPAVAQAVRQRLFRLFEVRPEPRTPTVGYVPALRGTLPIDETTD